MARRIRRAQLFVPGNNEKMIRKAAEIRVDSVILDLEDAVPPDQKDRARKVISEMLGELEFKSPEVCVRINSLSLREGFKDVDFVAGLDRVETIVVPKAESGLNEMHSSTGKSLIALIETPRGVLDLERIASSEGIEAIAWGAGDLSFAVGGETSAYERNTYVMTRLVMTCRAFGLDAIDRVYFDIGNIAGLIDEATNARNLGFTGKQVIHPTHVEPVKEVFSPSMEQVEWATRVINAFKDSQSAGRGALRMDGQLIDMVHVRMAEKILSMNESVS